MTIDWNKDQPAVEFLRSCIATCFPEVGLHYDAMKTVAPKARKTVWDHPSHGVGGYVPRQTAAGGFSLHSQGRAADIYVKIESPYLKAIGDAIFDSLIANAAQLNIQEVLWNRQMWSASVPQIHSIPNDKHHKQHLDHVQVGFTSAGSQARPRLLLTALQQARSVVEAQFP